MTKELTDRIETFDYLIIGHCRKCHKSYNANVGSDCTPRADKVRYYQPSSISNGCMVSCDCGEYFPNNFVAEKSFH